MRRIVFFSVLAAAAGVVAWAWVPAAAPAPGWGAAYDLSARPPEAIPPGTVVGSGAPPGWSHLVLKSQPRIRALEAGRVNAQTARMASWMFTAFLADVRPDDAGRHRLRAAALGLGRRPAAGTRC